MIAHGLTGTSKYQRLRNDASFQSVPSASDGVVVRMLSSLDPAHYDEPLTLLTNVPASWGDCTASQCGRAVECSVQDGQAVYDARLGEGDIMLQRE